MKWLWNSQVAPCLGVLLLGAALPQECRGGADSRLAAAIPVIEATIQRSGADVAVALRTLDGKTEWLLRADEPFHAASTMKVPVLIELCRPAYL